MTRRALLSMFQLFPGRPQPTFPSATGSGQITLTQPNNIQPPGFSIQAYPAPNSPLKDIGLGSGLVLLPPDSNVGYYRIASVVPQVQFPPDAVLQDGFVYLTLSDGTNVVSLDWSRLRQVFVER